MNALEWVIAGVVFVWSAQMLFDSWRASCAAAEILRTKFELIELTKSLESSQESLKKASESKSMFFASMSHELRTPLNAIVAFSEVISTEAFGPDALERYRSYAENILNSGRHLLGLINDLLDLAKIEAGKFDVDPKWCDGRSIVQECVDLLSESARRKEITVRILCAPTSPTVYADERAMKQIVTNLLANALKYAPRKSVVRAKLVVGEAGADLSIEDAGQGIPADQIDRITKPFEQLDNRLSRANGGTGLGLALVRELAEMHGGEFTIYSKVGVGTSATVRFPNTQAKAIKPNSPSRHMAA
jgi:two-component system cell cycle sensor histidine kinase PleC